MGAPGAERAWFGSSRNPPPSCGTLQTAACSSSGDLGKDIPFALTPSSSGGEVVSNIGTRLYDRVPPLPGPLRPAIHHARPREQEMTSPLGSPCTPACQLISAPERPEPPPAPQKKKLTRKRIVGLVRRCQYVEVVLLGRLWPCVTGSNCWPLRDQGLWCSSDEEGFSTHRVPP